MPHSCSARFFAARTRAALIGAALVASSLALQRNAEGRDAVPATRKAYLHVLARELELAWNAEQGEEGRGDGEVFLFTVASWRGAAVERRDPQKNTFGELGGAAEVKSGAVYEDPPNSGKYKIRPAKVKEGLGKLYQNYADCPVPTSIFVSGRLWEDDNNTDIKFFAKLIGDGIDALVNGAAAAAAGGVQVPTPIEMITDGLVKLIDWLTYSKDDELGRFSTTISFPDPCAGDFFIPEKWIDIENRAADLWQSVNAEDSTGTPFSSYGITPPANIGRLKVSLWGGTLQDEYASCLTPPYQLAPDSLGHWQITRVDIGQASECTITASLDTKATIPRQDVDVSYSVFLDTDHQIATGSIVPESQGAEYELRLPLTNSAVGVAPMLFRYDVGSGSFQLVAGAVVSGEVDLDGSTVFLTSDLQSLGNPADSVAAWAIARSSHGDYVAPPDADLKSPVIEVREGYNGLHPTLVSTYPTAGARDVPPNDDLVFEFSKHMNRGTVPPALHFDPPIPGALAWDGNRATFHPSVPLSPGTMYRVRVTPLAMDCLGSPLDGDGDLVPGDAYESWFTTRPAPLFAANAEGYAKDRFVIGDHAYATGESFPPFAQADLYVIADDSLHVLGGWPLHDATGGAEAAAFDAFGDLALQDLGPLLTEGEFHVVADVNRNALFDPGVDRIDRTGIGFAVLGSSIDGVRDTECSVYAAVQTSQTGAGNATLGLPGFANGSELDAVCATYDADALRLFIAGNLQSDFSKLEIFFDCAPGGQQRLRDDNPDIDFGGLNRMGSLSLGSGLRFDSGFDADYWVGVTGGDPGDGSYHLYANYATLPTDGGGVGYYLGNTHAAGDGVLVDGTNPVGIRAAIHNGNVAGVTAGCGSGSGAADPLGVELQIPYAALGHPTGCIKITMFVNGSGHDFVSNQFLASLPPGICSLGEPRAVDLAAVPGLQHFTTCHPGLSSDRPPSTGLAVLHAYPNPTTGGVRLRWSGTAHRVTAHVYDIAGRHIRTIRAPEPAAEELVWDGRSEVGARLPAGLYLVRVQLDDRFETLRVVLLR